MILNRVLMITFGSVVQPQGGWAVRARAALDAWSAQGIKSVVISTIESCGDQPGGVPGLASEVYVLKQPLLYGWSSELASLCRKVAPTVDAIVVESALFLPAVFAAGASAQIIWDTTECETLHYMRMAPTPINRLKGFVWKHIESWAAKRSDVVVAISQAEERWWHQLFPKEMQGKTLVVDHTTNAVPVSREEAQRTTEELCGLPLRGPVFVFVGALVAKHNAAAAEWLLTSLAPRLPEESTLILVGPGTELLSPPAVKANVCCVGAVPNVDRVIAAADFCLAPLAFGAGVKTKVLHYLAHGIRTIGTPIAFEGIENAPGIVTAALDDLPTVTLECLRQMEPPELRQVRQSAQRSYVQSHHGLRKVTEQWACVFRQAGEAVRRRVGGSVSGGA